MLGEMVENVMGETTCGSLPETSYGKKVLQVLFFSSILPGDCAFTGQNSYFFFLTDGVGALGEFWKWMAVVEWRSGLF